MKMAKKDKEFRLCYVRSNILYFTDNFKKQWGDDWNDAPYDCNAGEPYEWNEEEDEAWNKNHGHLRYIGIKSDGWLKVTGCFGDAYNVNYSVEEINKGAVAWLYSEEAGGLQGGATMAETIEWCRKAKIKWGELTE